MKRVGAEEMDFEEGKYKINEEAKIKGKIVKISFSKI